MTKIVLIYRQGQPKIDCAWSDANILQASNLHKFLVNNGIDAMIMAPEEYNALPERLVPRDQFGEARADAIFNEFVATKAGSLKPAMEQTKAMMDALPAAPKTDMEHYRMTPEKKAFSDARVAENVRFFYREEDKLAGYTDEQVAYVYEHWKDDNLDDANITTLAQRIDYRDLLVAMFGKPEDADPEPGEHQEVIDALKEC